MSYMMISVADSSAINQNHKRLSTVNVRNLALALI